VISWARLSPSLVTPEDDGLDPATAGATENYLTVDGSRGINARYSNPCHSAANELSRSSVSPIDACLLVRALARKEKPLVSVDSDSLNGELLWT
jgi:hypothetical protein